MTKDQEYENVEVSLVLAAILSVLFGLGTSSWLVSIGTFLIVYVVLSMIYSIYDMNKRILENQKKIMKDLDIVEG